ncbi:MAG: hypothetical protein U0800_25310 [Isosphaeraceae bacterium]
MDSELLAGALAAIEAERDNRPGRGSELVRRLIADRGEADLAERLYREIPIGCPWELVADLFKILIWNTADNGLDVCRTAARWLEANDDLRRIRVALHIGANPYLSGTEMTHVLVGVAARHPEVADRCRELLESQAIRRVAIRAVRMRSSRRGFEGSDCS